MEEGGKALQADPSGLPERYNVVAPFLPKRKESTKSLIL
jgi:hypothetical protein